MNTRKELAHLVATLTARVSVNDRSAGMIVADALKLCRIAASATRHATNLCNIPNYQATWDKKVPALRVQANAVAQHYYATAKIQGDPRGCVLRLFAAPGSVELRGNTFGGNESGYGI